MRLGDLPRVAGVALPLVQEFGYTREIERELDQVAQGSKKWTDMLHEFHDELNALAHAYQDSQCAELPPGAQWVIDCLQQSLQASQHTWRQAQQAAHASALLTQQAWAQHPTRKTGKRQR